MKGLVSEGIGDVGDELVGHWRKHGMVENGSMQAELVIYVVAVSGTC